jgi:hypothetical protein
MSCFLFGKHAKMPYQQKKIFTDDTSHPILYAHYVSEQIEETPCHILWSCPSAQDVWMEGSRSLQKSLTDEADFINLFGTLLEKLEERELQFFVAVARQLWFRRNSVVLFKGTMCSPAAILKKARDQVDEYEKALLWQRTRTSTPNSNKPAMKWSRPSVGFVKINWDASIDPRGGCMGVGLVARNHEGRVLATFCDRIYYIREAAQRWRKLWR